MELVVTKSRVYDYDPTVITTILLYQQEPDIILHKALVSRGFKVITPTDDEVKEAISELNFGIAILDFWQEPGDLTLLTLLRHLDSKRPCLMLCKYGNYEYQLAALKAKCDNYIVKPIHLPVFMQYLENFLRRCKQLNKIELSGVRPKEIAEINGVKLYPEDACLLYKEGTDDQIVVPLGPTELIIIKLLYEAYTLNNDLVPKQVMVERTSSEKSKATPNVRILDSRIMTLRKKLRNLNIPLELASKRVGLQKGYALQII